MGNSALNPFSYFSAAPEPGADKRVMNAKIEMKWIEAIRTGQKKVECRIRAGEWANIQVGQKIMFYSETVQAPGTPMEKSLVLTSVAAVSEHKSFEAALTQHGTVVLPGVSSIGEAVEQYRANYPDATDAESKNGVIAMLLLVVVAPATTTPDDGVVEPVATTVVAGTVATAPIDIPGAGGSTAAPKA